MARSLLSALGRNCRRHKDIVKIFALLLMFLSASKGLSVEETRLLSSQEKIGKGNISIRISESVKDTKTVENENLLSNSINSPDIFKQQNVIVSTELVTNSSYIEDGEEETKKEVLTKERLEKDFRQTEKLSNEENTRVDKLEDTGGTRETKESRVSDNYYDIIKPTKTVSVKELKIAHTEIEEGKNSGEEEGVSMSQSRPRKTSKEMSYNRMKRGFDNPGENIASFDGEKKKSMEKNYQGKSYNQIEKTLGKIAKIAINEEAKQETLRPTIAPTNFRESREEENRKANPDIQDIITGIVNILNGKTTKQSEGNTGRPPRPTSTRINNRGPPRISDVPPLDFDNPPPYRPLPPPPPPPPKRVPPPYPFDVPPSMPNIPLPPQPHKPGLSKLPSHPFIDGVPIPEMVVPGEHKKPPSNRPSEHILSEYDTISMSAPIDGQHLHSIVTLNTTKKFDPSQEVSKNITKTENVKVSQEQNLKNTTKVIKNNQTAVMESKTELNKTKETGQKVTSNSNIPNKNLNKRPRPNPGSRPTEKPIQKTTPSGVKEEKNKTAVTGIVDIVPPKKNITLKETGNKVEVLKSNQTKERPLREEIINGTKKTGEVIDNPFKGSANISAILNLKPPAKEIKKNTTESPAVTSTTTTLSQEKPTKVVGGYKETEKFEIDLELPMLLEPTLGVGEATPVLESSILELSLLPNEQSSTATPVISTTAPTPVTETSQYKARPGIVLDDPEYKPGGHKRPIITGRPIITAPPPHSHYGEIFDVTVHAVQGPGEKSSAGNPFIVAGNIEGVHLKNPQIVKGDVAVITKPEDGQNFVSIEGKRTYINLFGEVSSTKISPTSTQPPITGTGYAIPHKESPVHPSSGNRPVVSTSPPRRPYKKPSHPPVRIDTCIVGDDTTCDSTQNEMCRTEDGVSSCHCRPGYNRRKHRDTCRRVVSMLTSMRVDRLYDRKVKWQPSLRDPESEEYQQLSYEASQAIESAMSMTPFSDDFINSRINSIYVAKNLENNEPAVYVNVTIQLEENLDTVRPAVRQDIQRHLLRVIQRRNNNVGNSAVWVDAPPGSILALQDVDECSSSDLHDCHERAICLNTFGNFKCQCPDGLRDPWLGNIHREGRFCESCPTDYCNNRGECKFEHGQQVCQCSGSFYGAQCEIDGEVLGVAIGASLAAAIIIVLTLICLCMWSRRWSREQKSAVGVGMGSPVFGYMATGPTVKTPSVGAPPYQVSIEDRIRWAQIADVMAKSNHYAQPEPVNATTRNSFGAYPTLPSHTMTMPGTLPLPAIAPPVPLPRLTLANKPPMSTYGAHSQIGSLHHSNHGVRSSLETTSSSEEEDRADLLGRNFNVPRPKSRTSVANQSGIYYDVDFDRSDAYSKQNTIPMNTYTLNPQHQIRPYFR